MFKKRSRVSLCIGRDLKACWHGISRCFGTVSKLSETVECPQGVVLVTWPEVHPKASCEGFSEELLEERLRASVLRIGLEVPLFSAVCNVSWFLEHTSEVPKTEPPRTANPRSIRGITLDDGVSTNWIASESIHLVGTALQFKISALFCVRTAWASSGGRSNQSSEVSHARTLARSVVVCIPQSVPPPCYPVPSSLVCPRTSLLRINQKKSQSSPLDYPKLSLDICHFTIGSIPN